MIETLILGVGAFIGTNLDDMLIGTLLFATTKSKAETRSIVVGKYVGMAVLVSVSILAACGLQFLPPQYIRYLGLVPIALGIREAVRYLRNGAEKDGEKEYKTGNQWLNAALITIANGADNIGVYVPLFAGLEAWQMAEVVGVFAVLVAVWCYLGKKLSDLPVLKAWLDRYRQIIIPIVYVAIGLYVLLG